MPDTPREEPPSEDFNALLDDMLARVSAAARQAHALSREPQVDHASDTPPSEAGDKRVATEAALGIARDGPIASASAEAGARIARNALEPVDANLPIDDWADTTPAPLPDLRTRRDPPMATTPPGDVPSAPVDDPPAAMMLPGDPPWTGSSTTAVGLHARAASTNPQRWIARAGWCAAALATATAAWTGARHALPDTASSTRPASLDSLPPTSAGRVPTAPVAARNAVAERLPLDVAIDAEASTESRMIAELRGAIGSAFAATGSSTFTVARYDALPAAKDGWQVVATLGTEEVYALVPTASPLRHLRDLQGRRINVGPAGSARAISGAALYRTLFDTPLPTSSVSALARDDALRRMLATRDLDALLLFDGQPSSWLAALPEPTRRALRILPLEPGEAVGRRALQRYLPARLGPILGADGASVQTLAEVTFLIAPAQGRDAAPLLRALCDHLPALRAGGHPKWQEVDPSLRLPIGLPRPAELDSVLAGCAATSSLTSTHRRSS